MIFESGPEKGKTIRLDEDRVYTLGRDERAEVRIDLELVSRAHAKLRGKEGRFYLKDHESSNGTYVNDARIEGVHELASGDRISIGSMVISYFADTEAGGAAGKTLGGFQLLQRLGRGGMGTVYRALQKSLNREVALKILAPELARDQKFVQQFLKEARACGQLNHPNIVQVYDVETDAGLVFYAMEYMKGGTVEDRVNRIAQDGPIPLDQALGWMLDAARGLQYAEMKRIIHRDIKPDNLMLTDIGGVKIADLGLALGAHEGAGDVGIHGTPHFISPEQARGEKLDTRSDLYSLGATSFRILTGRTLFTGESAQEILRKQVKEPPPSVRSLRSDCPEKVAAIVTKLLQKDPAQRFQTPGDLVAAIEEARVKQNRAATAALVLVLLLTVVGGVGWYLGWFGGSGGNAPIVQQIVVTNQEDADRAREAEERARRAERETKALEAYGALTQQRPSLDDTAYLAELRRFAESHTDTEVATRVTTEAEALQIAINEREAAAANRAQRVAEATGRLDAAIDVPLRGKHFADAYAALGRADFGEPEIVASEEFVAALAAARARVDAAVEAAVAAFTSALDDALVRHDFAAARAALASAAPSFVGAENLPDAAAAERLTKIVADTAAAKERIDGAERDWIATTHAADLATFLTCCDWKALFEGVRAWRVEDRTNQRDLPTKLTTPHYRSIGESFALDVAAFDGAIAEVREVIGRGGLTNARVRHPEREGFAEISGLANEGAGVMIQVSRGAARSSSAVAFSAFSTPAAFVDLLDGRIAATPQSAARAVRATLFFAAAQLAPAIERLREQFASYDYAKGWTDEQRAALAGIYVPTIDVAVLEPWLGLAESDPSTAALGSLLRKRAQREARALDLLASALLPFADKASTVRFGFAADQMLVIAEELRDTLVFLVAYPIFDDGTRHFALAATP